MENVIKEIKTTEDKAQKIITDAQNKAITDTEAAKTKIANDKETELKQLNEKVNDFLNNAQTETETEIDKIKDENKQLIVKYRKTDINNAATDVVKTILEK